MDSTPSKARYVVTAFAVSLAVITYIDRVGMPVGPSIRDDLGSRRFRWAGPSRPSPGPTPSLKSPAGGSATGSAPRRVLMRIVMWWSFFTAATGWVWNPLARRDARAVRRRRGRRLPQPTRDVHDLAAVASASAPRPTSGLPRAGAVRSLRCWWPLISGITWRRTFELFGVIGVIWAVAVLSLVPRRSRGAPAGRTRPNWRCCRRRRTPAIAHSGCPGR